MKDRNARMRYGLLRGRTIFNFTLKRLARFDLRIDSSARRYPIAAEVLRSSNELRFLSGVLLARIRRRTGSRGSAALHPWLTKSVALPLATTASCASSPVLTQGLASSALQFRNLYDDLQGFDSNHELASLGEDRSSSLNHLVAEGGRAEQIAGSVDVSSSSSFV